MAASSRITPTVRYPIYERHPAMLQLRHGSENDVVQPLMEVQFFIK